MSSREKKHRLFICGGGTGGHFFSGVALGEKCLSLYPLTKIYFIGTSRGIEARTELNHPQMRKLFIWSRGLVGKNPFQMFIALASIFVGFLQSLWLLVRYRPRAIVGVGGYASAPTVFAALLLHPFFGWKVAVLEQNSFAGRANQLFARMRALAFCGFQIPEFECVDLPIRQKAEQEAHDASVFHWPPRTILVVGGSQGARGLNAKWMEIFPQIKETLGPIKMIHQTGRLDERRVRDFYLSQKVEADVFDFSSQLHEAYKRADLIICRAGAMTVFEIMAFKRPCVFIPFPAAADDHQFKNAIAVHNHDWVIREKDWTAQQMLNLLKMDSPPLPGHTRPKTREWSDIFKQLLS